MNLDNLKSNLVEAKKGFLNENVKVSLETKLPDGVKVSDGKGRGTPLPKGKNSVAVIAYKNIVGLTKSFDFFLLTVATADGSLFDVSVDGNYPAIEGNSPTKMWEVDCVHNAKGYPIVTFSNVATPIVVAAPDSEIKV